MRDLFSRLFSSSKHQSNDGLPDPKKEFLFPHLVSRRSSISATRLTAPQRIRIDTMDLDADVILEEIEES